MALLTVIRMESEWAATGSGPTAEQALARLAAIEPAIADLGLRDLAGLTSTISSQSRTVAPSAAARVIAAMVRSAASHPLIARAVVQAMLPGTVAVAMAVGPAGPWEDLDVMVSDAVRMTWEIVTGWQGQDRPWAVRDITNALRHRLRRELLAWRRDALRAAPGADQVVVLPGEERSTLERLAVAIADRAASDLAHSDAVAVYGRRVLGFTLVEMAERTAQTPRQVEYRTMRGERWLATA